MWCSNHLCDRLVLGRNCSDSCLWRAHHVGSLIRVHSPVAQTFSESAQIIDLFQYENQQFLEVGGLLSSFFWKCPLAPSLNIVKHLNLISPQCGGEVCPSIILMLKLSGDTGTLSGHRDFGHEGRAIVSGIRDLIKGAREKSFLPYQVSIYWKTAVYESRKASWS